MKTINQLAFILTVCASTLSAHAVEIRGARSCGKWIAGQADGQSASNEAWLVGFMSGLAFQSNQDLLKGTDNESITLWVNNFCQKNPLENLVTAAETLANELAKKRGIRR